MPVEYMDLFLTWKLNTVLDWLPQLNTELVSLCLDLWAVGRMHYMCQFGLQPPHTVSVPMESEACWHLRVSPE